MQKWQDYSLQWNTSHYSGFKTLNISPDKLWVPDIALYNKISTRDRDHKKTLITANVIVLPNGTCRWLVPTFVHTICSIDVSFFPLDIQQCSLRYGSLSYSDSELQIEKGDLIYPSSNFMKNGEWSLWNVSIKTDKQWDSIRGNNFTVVEVTLKMKRNSLYYIIAMLVPCFLISCLTMLGFILPPESGERMTLGMLTLLAMTFFQKLMMKIIPLQDFPIISQYFFLTSLEIGLALFVTTITLKFYASDKEMPRVLEIVVLRFLGRITRIYKSDDGKEAMQRQSSFSSNHNNSEMQFDIELTENCSSFSREKPEKTEKTEEGLNKSPIGLVYYADDRSLTSNSSNSSMKKTDTDEEEENKKKSAKWKEDWLLAARIVDRFALWMSFVIGLLTIMVVFLRAPSIWNSI